MIRSLYRVKLQRILCGGAFLLEQGMGLLIIKFIQSEKPAAISRGFGVRKIRNLDQCRSRATDSLGNGKTRPRLSLHRQQLGSHND